MLPAAACPALDALAHRSIFSDIPSVVWIECPDSCGDLLGLVSEIRLADRSVGVYGKGVNANFSISYRHRDQGEVLTHVAVNLTRQLLQYWPNSLWPTSRKGDDYGYSHWEPNYAPPTT